MSSLPCAPPDPAAAAPDFDRLAPFYRWMEWFSFGPWLWRCRCAMLPLLGRGRQALVLGDGDGRFTARLLRAWPETEVDAVDASGAMLEALLRRAGRERVRAFCADVRSWQPARPRYDLVVTHFFLDCLATGEVEALAERMAGVPVNQLMMQKLMVNQAIEAMGLKTTQMIATIFDGITRHSPEGLNFKHRAEQVGWKEAVRNRDQGTWDWTENRSINPRR